jgi:hypothetical protein
MACLFVHPPSRLQGGFEVNVGWAAAPVQYPGVLYPNSAGYPPGLTKTEVLTAAENAQPSGPVGEIYYPGQTVTLEA